MTNTPLLSRAECTILRGIAIIGIFLHNFCHWLGPMVKENEYTFRISNVVRLQGVMAFPDEYLPVHLLSFFGHYGVPTFLFLSAYGLVLKYEKNLSPTNSFYGGDVPVREDGVGHQASSRMREGFRFVRYQFLKLFRMMIVGYVAFLMINPITPERHHYEFIDIVGQLFMFNNLLPNPDRVIWPGPFWFFGLMLQFYAIYVFLLKGRGWKLTVLLMALCTLVQMVCDPESDALNRLHYNFIGGMLPFGLGLLMARHCPSSLFARMMSWHYAVVAAVSVVVIYFASLNYYSWYFVPVFVCLFCVSFVKILPSCTVTGWIEWIGSISYALFVCHPIVRKIFIQTSRHGDIYTGILLYFICSLGLAWLFHMIISKIPMPKLRR